MTGPVFAQDETAGSRASAEVSLGLGSRYVWRGMRLSEGIVSQVAIDVGFHGLGVGFWTNFDPREYPVDSGSRRRITETDVTFSYGRPLRGGVLSGGLVYYGQRGVPGTSELFVAYEMEAPLGPSAALYVDADEGDGAFVVLSAGRSMALSEAVALEVGVEAGVNLKNKVMGTDEEGRGFAGLYHAEVGAGTSIPIGRGAAVTSRLAVSVPLGRRAGDAIAASSYDAATRRCVYGSVGLTVAF
ncbi:MAG TPA: hypothetical protein VK911_00035 [Vicinamibacterales bacterium]|nr:hypothetical protein [Vicinamibacterales bacterium]